MGELLRQQSLYLTEDVHILLCLSPKMQSNLYVINRLTDKKDYTNGNKNIYDTWFKSNCNNPTMNVNFKAVPVKEFV